MYSDTMVLSGPEGDAQLVGERDRQPQPGGRRQVQRIPFPS